MLRSIPGIADTIAAWLLGEIQFHSFKSAKQVAAFAGLTPKRKESGTSLKGKSRVSKIGNTWLRKALYMPAIVAKRFDPVVKALCTRLEERGKHTMQIICAAMRKLIPVDFQDGIFGRSAWEMLFQAGLLKGHTYTKRPEAHNRINRRDRKMGQTLRRCSSFRNIFIYNHT